MKQLTDTERLKIAMGILDERQVDEYANRCAELEQDEEQARDITDVVVTQRPIECEDEDCAKCRIEDGERRKIDCSYVD